MRELITLMLIVAMLIIGAAVAVHLWRRANYRRWLSRGHSDYKLRPRRGLFG
jgi:hypothetical protein